MFEKSKKVILRALVVPACMAVMSMTAFAGNSFEGYDTNVGMLNGSGYSNTQVKATSGANGAINSTSVSGDYLVDVRMEKNDGSACGDWFRDLNDNMQTGYVIDGHKGQAYGDSVRLKFSNDLTTLVKVQVVGTWCSQ
ncbi:MAG: hypothetical protein IJZ82_02145 [Lachnospiraceae bacterium]|nr:hypothetical protein [Lachnospiraceae bacterium]